MLKKDLIQGLQYKVAKLLKANREKILDIIKNLVVFNMLYSGDELFMEENIISDEERDSIKKLIKKIITNKIELANRGWFISDIILRDILELRVMVESLTNDSVDDLEILLKKLIVSNLGYIQMQLIELLPNRQSIINDLFYAHNNHKFSLSTAVFLSQADGVAHDLGGENIFHLPKPTSNKLQEFLNQQNQSYISLMKNIIYSFDTDSNNFNKMKADVDLFKSEGKRESDFKGLNRHLVLHGIDVNYGTEENSLKALSFLCCMCSLFSKRINEFKYLNDE